MTSWKRFLCRRTLKSAFRYCNSGECRISTVECASRPEYEYAKSIASDWLRAPRYWDGTEIINRPDGMVIMFGYVGSKIIIKK